MPLRNEHAARQIEPSRVLFAKFRRKTWSDARGIAVIYGITHTGRPIVQSIRFRSTLWTPQEARAWLAAHGFRTVLERAARKRGSPQRARLERSVRARRV